MSGNIPFTMEDVIRNSYEVIIGLEVHVQLNTQSKIFCADPVAFGKEPNTLVGIVSLGLPGTLPRLNREVVSKGLQMALACHCDISRTQHFDRKNYFYPDLPKGYQLTQDRSPLARGGYLAVPVRESILRIPLQKIHLEEDAGKSMHDGDEKHSRVDFNRAGIPLLEIVTKPSINTPADAAAAVSEIRRLVRFLGVSDGNMEQGSLRCDANVSIRSKGSSVLGRKVEIKNLNSTRNLTHALDYDIERQIGLAEAGLPVTSETRGFDAVDGKTFPQRVKEALNDYRYFPDPDLPQLEVSDAWLEEIRATLPVLPEEWFNRMIDRYQLSPYDALVVSETLQEAEYFESLCALGVRPKAAANWMMGPLKSLLNDRGWEMSAFPVAPGTFASAIGLVESNQVSFSAVAQKLLPVLLSSPGREPVEVARELGLILEEDDAALDKVISGVLREFPLKVEAYREGKKGIVAMFMGEVMKRTAGKANPRKANELLTKKLSE